MYLEKVEGQIRGTRHHTIQWTRPPGWEVGLKVREGGASLPDLFCWGSKGSKASKLVVYTSPTRMQSMNAPEDSKELIDLRVTREEWAVRDHLSKDARGTKKCENRLENR